jgi:malonyl-CoA/methylmalonyl-CoA synthetase
MTICILPPEEHRDPAAVVGCAGYPFLHVDVTLEREGEAIQTPDDFGEVVVHSDHVMEGYWRAEEATIERFTQEGGLRTQDLGRWDEQGRLWLVGRTREMFISGGYNVFPGEVERRLGHVGGVRDLAVFSLPHPRWGEAAVLAVVPESLDAEDGALLADIDRTGRERLAAYERPKQVVIVDELPLTAVGKVSRSALAERFQSLFRSQ